MASRGNRIILERNYDASLSDVWALWTTKEGIESWWGPEGFRVEVKKLDLRPGGELVYDMIAVAPEQVAFMERAQMPLSHEARITYQEVVTEERLAYTHLVDFVPGVEAYDVDTLVELVAVGSTVHMTLSLEPMHDDEWTRRAVAGWESELGKLEKVLAAG